MSRRRRSHSIQETAELATQVTIHHDIAPAMVGRDLVKVGSIYVVLLLVLVAVDYWQRQSGTPAQIGHALRVFVGF